MIKVTVVSPELRRQAYTDKAGKPAVLHFQTAYLHTIDRDGVVAPFPEKLEFIAERDEQGNPVAFQKGDYTLHPSSVYIDRNGRLAASLRLAPIPAPSRG